MDWETVATTYLEIKQEGRFKEDVVELLENEVSQCKVIYEKDKILLAQLFQDLRQTKQYGESEIVKDIYNILIKYDGFNNQLNKIATDILLGKRKLFD
ncbi:MAG: hypothetical protein ACOC80_14060 [Petrotogales bacterium]